MASWPSEQGEACRTSKAAYNGWLMAADQSSSRKLRVFLCHASGDKPAVGSLYQRLRHDGCEPWLDEEELLPGQDWREEIPKAVRGADAVLVCLSSRSINKEGYVQKEVRFALDAADEKPEGTIFLIPGRLEECRVPERLNRWQWVDLFKATGYERLLRALRLRAEQLGLKTDNPSEGMDFRAVLQVAKSWSFVDVKAAQRELFKEMDEARKRELEAVKAALLKILSAGPGSWQWENASNVSFDGTHLTIELGEIYPGNARDLMAHGWKIENGGWTRPPDTPSHRWNWCTGSWELNSSPEVLDRIASAVLLASDLETLSLRPPRGA